MLKKFFQYEAAGGICLLIAMIVAMIWANSPWAHTYHEIVHFPIGFYFGHFKMEETLHFWVNDALMAIFFFVVSLEIKREMILGELSTKKKAALPMIAAFGGMVCPAVIYALFNPTGPAASGWGIPMATDIAFSVGVLTVLGKRVRLALKVFLLTLAVADDLGGIIVIAFFYTQKIQMLPLLAAFAFFATTYFMRRFGIRNVWAYIVIGIGAWFSLLFSGVHATISGVVLAFMTPIAPLFSQDHTIRKINKLTNDLEKTYDRYILHEIHNLSREAVAPLSRFSHRLHGIVNFGILPLFAFLNTGIVIANENLSEIIRHPVFMGVSLGLIFGKPIGIFIATWIGVKLNLGELPERVDFFQIFAVGFIAGIGFTVATFMSHLSLSHAPDLEVYSKMGILIASVGATLLGSLALAASRNR